MSLFGYILYEHFGLSILVIALILFTIMLSVVVLSVGMHGKKAAIPSKTTIEQQSTSLWQKNPKAASTK